MVKQSEIKNCRKLLPPQARRTKGRESVAEPQGQELPAEGKSAVQWGWLVRTEAGSCEVGLFQVHWEKGWGSVMKVMGLS